MSNSNDIKVGDLLECVRCKNSTILTLNKRYEVSSESAFGFYFMSDVDTPVLIRRRADGNYTSGSGSKFKKVKAMNKFKVGESVYRFSVIDGVTIEVIEDADYNSEDYRLGCRGNTYTKNGYIHKYANIPSLYKLNQANYDKLCAFVGADEVPKLPLLGSDLTIGILKNQSLQACFCSDDSDEDARSEACLALIVRYQDGSFFDINGASWFKAVSVDNNRNEITELPRSDL